MNNPVIDKFGHKFWYDNQNKLHRENGPAIEYSNGDKYWIINNRLHKENGPAIEYANGYKAWYYNGRRLDCNTQEEFELLMKLQLFW